MTTTTTDPTTDVGTDNGTTSVVLSRKVRDHLHVSDDIRRTRMDDDGLKVRPGTLSDVIRTAIAFRIIYGRTTAVRMDPDVYDPEGWTRQLIDGSDRTASYWNLDPSDILDRVGRIAVRHLSRNIIPTMTTTDIPDDIRRRVVGSSLSYAVRDVGRRSSRIRAQLKAMDDLCRTINDPTATTYVPSSGSDPEGKGRYVDGSGSTYSGIGKGRDVHSALSAIADPGPDVIGRWTDRIDLDGSSDLLRAVDGSTYPTRMDRRDTGRTDVPRSVRWTRTRKHPSDPGCRCIGCRTMTVRDYSGWTRTDDGYPVIPIRYGTDDDGRTTIIRPTVPDRRTMMDRTSRAVGRLRTYHPDDPTTVPDHRDIIPIIGKDDRRPDVPTYDGSGRVRMDDGTAIRLPSGIVLARDGRRVRVVDPSTTIIYGYGRMMSRKVYGPSDIRSRMMTDGRPGRMIVRDDIITDGRSVVVPLYPYGWIKVRDHIDPTDDDPTRPYCPTTIYVPSDVGPDPDGRSRRDIYPGRTIRICADGCRSLSLVPIYPTTDDPTDDGRPVGIVGCPYHHPDDGCPYGCPVRMDRREGLRTLDRMTVPDGPDVRTDDGRPVDVHLGPDPGRLLIPDYDPTTSIIRRISRRTDIPEGLRVGKVDLWTVRTYIRQ